jgi:hypothetical protein
MLFLFLPSSEPRSNWTCFVLFLAEKILAGVFIIFPVGGIVGDFKPGWQGKFPSQRNKYQ